MSSPSNSTTGASRGGRLTRLIERLRTALLGALEDENIGAAQDAGRDDSKDLYERLPEPVHLDHGAVKYTDGKLRFLD